MFLVHNQRYNLWYIEHMAERLRDALCLIAMSDIVRYLLLTPSDRLEIFCRTHQYFAK